MKMLGVGIRYLRDGNLMVQKIIMMYTDVKIGTINKRTAGIE